jgi:hypothetical protein
VVTDTPEEPALSILMLKFKTQQIFAIFLLKFTLKQAMKAQRGSRDIALLLFNLGTRWAWVVSATPWPLYSQEKDLVPIKQEAGVGSSAGLDGCRKSFHHWDLLSGQSSL